jgi:hypothetical protein
MRLLFNRFNIEKKELDVKAKLSGCKGSRRPLSIA